MLLDSAFEPITTTIGFLKKSTSEVVAEDLKWQHEIFKDTEVKIETRPIHGKLPDVLKALLPLVNGVYSRMVFAPTASEWTAYFDNGWRGTDAAGPMSVLAGKLHCEGMRVTAVHHHMPKKPKPDEPTAYGAMILEVYDPTGKSRRTITAANDGGSWVFDQSGEPYPFEDVEAYATKRIRDRFTVEMLEKYLKHLGLDAFNKDWYMPNANSEAVLITRKGGPSVEGEREYTLHEARVG
jgi:hypothetical protein